MQTSLTIIFFKCRMMIKIVLIAELPIPVVRMTPSIGFNQFLIFVDYVEPTGVVRTEIG